MPSMRNMAAIFGVILLFGMMCLVLIGTYLHIRDDLIVACSRLKPPEENCDQKLEMERYLHREYYRQWAECSREVGIYTRKSVDLVCLGVVTELHEELDELYDEQIRLHAELGECQHNALQVQVVAESLGMKYGIPEGK